MYKKHECIRSKENQTFRILGVKQEDLSKVSIDTIVIPTLIYDESTPTFHQWGELGIFYGLNFDSAEMASKFAHEMKIALQYVKGELEWSSVGPPPPPPRGKSRPSPPPRPPRKVPSPSRPGPGGPSRGPAPDFRFELERKIAARKVAENFLTPRTPSPQAMQTDNSFGFGTIEDGQVSVDQLVIPKYDEDSYVITGKKVCLVLVISRFD